MNLIENIYNALNGKGYDDFTKIRWIYLYVCELFSYDTRYYIASDSMKLEIYNTEINPTNVEEFEVVCYALSRVLIDVLEEFGYKGEIIRETDKTFTHVYVHVKMDGYILRLDPTKHHDITRVKMNIPTKDFEALSDYEYFSDMLMHADKAITSDFSNFQVSENTLKDTVNKILQEISQYADEHNLSESEVFLKKLEIIHQMVNSRTDLKKYSDIDFYYSYLLKIFKLKQISDKRYIRPVILFNVNDDSKRDIINISLVQFDNFQPIFYLIKKEGDSFKIREIFKDEALELLSNYENPIYSCQKMLVENAKRLATGKKNGIIL